MQLSDVTLREGAQMPDRAYTAEQLVEAGLALDRLGLAYLQPGFAASGEPDVTAIGELAERADTQVVSIARALERDVAAAVEAGSEVVEVFCPIDERRLELTIGKSPSAMLDDAEAAIAVATDHGRTAHFTIVDAFRTDPAVVADCYDRFADVEFVTLADTVGSQTPRAVAEYLEDLFERGVEPGRVGVHLHDDLGLATANALTAAEAGVGKADVSVASLGERAGNPALEEVVIAGVLDAEDSFGAAPDELIAVCEEVLDTLDEAVDPRKAILGREVTEHESPIHVAAMLAEPSLMEPFDPSRFGGSRTLIFGEKTGRGAARRLLERVGADADDETVERLLGVLAEDGPMDLETATAVAERIAG